VGVKRLIVVAVLFLGVAAATWSITEELEALKNIRPVIVVYSRAVDDPRAFEFNLAVSTDWLQVEQLDLAIIDVIPGVYDVDVVAEVLDIERYDFAVLLFDIDGERLFLSDRSDCLPELLEVMYDQGG